MVRPKGYMDFSLFCKVIDEVSGYTAAIRDKEIELFHFGESLLHRQLAEMVGYASSKGLKVVLSVNAPILTPELGRRILEQKPYKVIVSLDGYDEASYRRIRGPMADYRKAVDHVDALLAYASGVFDTGRICIRMIRMNENAHYEDRFRQNWSQSGATVEVRDFFPWNLHELTALGEVQKYPPFMPCPFPWQYLVVQWNGDVVPCCRDFNGENVLGNITRSSLKDIWNGSKMGAFRSRMLSGQYDNAICPECMQIYYTES